MTGLRLRRLAALAAVATCAAGLLAGCSNNAGGSGESGGELVVYSGREKELVAPLLERFAQETGIDIKVRYGTSAGLAAQIREEGDRSPADAFFAQDAGALGEVSDTGLFTNLDQTLLDRVPERFRASDGTWMGTSARARVVVVNTERVPDGERPTSVLQLTEPAWEGRVGIAPENASFQAFVSAMREEIGDERTRQWLTDMKANGTRDYPNNITIVEAVAAGEIDAGLVNHYYLPKVEAEKGPLPAENVFLPAGDPGSLVNVAGVGILKSAKNAENANRFVEWMLSDEAQNYLVQNVFEYALVPGIPPPQGNPPLDEVQSTAVDLSSLGPELQSTVEMLKETGWLA